MLLAMEPSIPVGGELAELISLTLDHGVSSVEEGDALIPFVLTEAGGQREIHRFVDEQPQGISLEGSLDRARKYVETLPQEVDRYTLAYDGYVTVEGNKHDAILVEAREVATPIPLLFAQRYQPKRTLRKARKIGTPIYLGSNSPEET